MQLRAVLVGLVVGADTSLAALTHRAMSFNIRFDNKDIGIGDSERPWLPSVVCQPNECRGPGVLGTIVNADDNATAAGIPATYGLQEVLVNQRNDLLELLNQIPNTKWQSAGVGRDDGGEAGEFVPILFRSDLWTLVSETTKWLSKTPDKPSKDFGSAEPRIVTMVVLEHKATGTRILRANCHLDNHSPEARTGQAGVLVEQIKALQSAQADKGANPLPVVLTGDFNSDTSDPAFQEMVKLGFLEDSFNMVPAASRTGGTATFTGFDGKFSSRLDFVWLGPRSNQPFKATKYTVIDNVEVGGVIRFSDHKPVLVEMTL